jgi:predicted Zn-ribbon and HTH transcriptional regulator
MKCALCGYEFTLDDVRCSSACPLASGCPVVCCPRCGYQTLDESRSALVRLARKARTVLKTGAKARKET